MGQTLKETWGCSEGGEGRKVILLVVAVSRASLSVLSVEAGHLQHAVKGRQPQESKVCAMCVLFTLHMWSGVVCALLQSLTDTTDSTQCTERYMSYEVRTNPLLQDGL